MGLKRLNYGSEEAYLWVQPLNLLLASNLLKTMSPVNCASILSTLGIGSVSLSTLLFDALGLTQICTAPVFLDTTAMSWSCSGTFLGECMGFAYIAYSSLNVPNPEKTFENSPLHLMRRRH